MNTYIHLITYYVRLPNFVRNKSLIPKEKNAFRLTLYDICFGSPGPRSITCVYTVFNVVYTTSFSKVIGT